MPNPPRAGLDRLLSCFVRGLRYSGVFQPRCRIDSQARSVTMTKRAGCPLLYFGLIFALAVYAGCQGSAATVVLTPNTPQTIGQGRTLPITATVSNDTSHAGVNWSLAPAMGRGTLGPSSKTKTTYNAPATVSEATTVTVTATSVAFPNQSATLSITVQPPPSVTNTS